MSLGLGSQAYHDPIITMLFDNDIPSKAGIKKCSLKLLEHGMIADKPLDITAAINAIYFSKIIAEPNTRSARNAVRQGISPALFLTKLKEKNKGLITFDITRTNDYRYLSLASNEQDKRSDIEFEYTMRIDQKDGAGFVGSYNKTKPFPNSSRVWRLVDQKAASTTKRWIAFENNKIVMGYGEVSKRKYCPCMAS